MITKATAAARRQQGAPDEHPANYTITPIALPAGATVPMKPEFIRLPRPGTLCPWTGLSRSKMWETLQSGAVKTVCLRKPGAAKGARLIHLAGLLDYLYSLAETLTPASKQEDEE